MFVCCPISNCFTHPVLLAHLHGWPQQDVSALVSWHLGITRLPVVSHFYYYTATVEDVYLGHKTQIRHANITMAENCHFMKCLDFKKFPSIEICKQTCDFSNRSTRIGGNSSASRYSSSSFSSYGRRMVSESRKQTHGLIRMLRKWQQMITKNTTGTQHFSRLLLPDPFLPLSIKE